MIGLLRHHPAAGAHGLAHAAQHHDRVEHVHEEEAAEGEVDRLGQQELLARLGDGDHLGMGRRRPAPPRRGRGVVVDRVDAPVVADDLGERDAHVAAARAHVDTAPALAQPQPVERGGERPAVHVVAQPELEHRLTIRHLE